MSSRLIENFVRKLALRIFLSQTVVTLNENQGHMNCSKVQGFSGVYHTLSCERYQVVNVRIHANTFFSFHNCSSKVLSLEYYLTR